jgi:hypothetical protein
MYHDIPLPPELVGVLSSHIYTDETKKHALYDFLETQTSEFISHLRAYRLDNIRGEIDDHSVELAEFENDAISLTDNNGAIWIVFMEEAYYGCKDMNNVQEHDEEITFTIDCSSGIITLHFMDEQEREDEL